MHDPTRRPGVLCLTGMLVVTAMPLAAADFDRGEALYENHCRSCHESWAHTRDGRTVGTLAGLRARVAAWGQHSGLQWTETDIDDVTRFLNRRFYQLTP